MKPVAVARRSTMLAIVALVIGPNALMIAGYDGAATISLLVLMPVVLATFLRQFTLECPRCNMTFFRKEGSNRVRFRSKKCMNCKVDLACPGK